MDLRKDCELIEVAYESEGKKAVLTFLDEEKGEVLEVNFNKQTYENGAYIDDEEKAKKVDEWCEQEFETDFSSLTQKIGTKKDVYHYENFNSLWESEFAQKFSDDMVGEIIMATITSVEDNGKMIVIQYTEKNTETLYKSNMSYSKYLEQRKEWFVDPVKKEKAFEKFKKKFGVDVKNADKIIGKDIMVEVKQAFGKFAYGDIKKPNWSK